MLLKALLEYLSPDDRQELDNVRKCARKILERPVDLAYTDHTISHKDIVVGHLDSFLRPWLAERAKSHGEKLVGTEVMVLLCATYLHDIGMQMVRPDILAALPSLSEEERREAAGLPNTNITEEHRAFSRYHHHRIGYDWIMGSQGDIPNLPKLTGIDGLRVMVAKVARAHNIWLTDRESYDRYKDGVEPQEEPHGTVRLDLLAAFLRLADILDQDKRRVDMEAMMRLPVAPVSQVHWWRHHYVNACRIDAPQGHNFPLTVAFRVPKAHEADQDWLKEALYSATIKEVEAESIRLKDWLGECGINVLIPPRDKCRFTIDPDATPMPDAVLDAFRKTWRRATGASDRASLHDAAAAGKLTADAVVAALPDLAAAVEIDEYVANTRRNLDGEFRDTPYSPLELRVDNQPGLRSALDHLEQQLQAPQVRPHPIVLIGAPGGGKTMLLRRYVWEWSGGGRAETPLPLYIQATRFGTAEWAAEVEPRLGTHAAPCSDEEYRIIVRDALTRFEALLAQSLCELAGLKIGHEQAMRGALIGILARTPLAVLFDGVNELPPMLYKLANWAVHAFLKSYRGHRVVVTSRTGDFRPGDFPDRVTCELAAMTEPAVADYWAKAGVPASAIRRFFEQATSGMRELAQTPMAAYMTGELLKLPDQDPIDNQGRLFQRYVRHTLRQWRDRQTARSLSADQAHDLLAEIAYSAFETQQVAFQPYLAKGVIVRWLDGLDPKDAARLNPHGESWESVSIQLLRELLSTGFLYEVGSPESPDLRFRHHTLQDYFAATAITRRWSQLPAIIAQPVFHEAVGLLAGVVDDPARFLERLADATSEGWGFIELLPLLFRVIGVSRAPVPQRVRLRIYAAALPLYSAAVALLSPFAVEVLCHLFSLVDWPTLAGFLAFIADEKNTRPEWERELARVDAIKAMNQDSPPTPGNLRPFFASRIPPELCQDYEMAKTTLLAMVGEQDDGTTLDRTPLLLGGLASSLSLNPSFKRHAGASLSKISTNQIGQLQAIFIDEIANFGSILIHTEEYPIIQSMVIRGIYEVIFLEYDAHYQLNNYSFLKLYFDRWEQLGCKFPLVQRLILYSADIPHTDLPRVLTFIDRFEFPPCLIFMGSASLPEGHGEMQRNAIHDDVMASIKQRRDTTDNPFLASWLSDFLGDTISDEQRQNLAPAIVAAGPAGYFLCKSKGWPIPPALARYEGASTKSLAVAAIDRFMAGDETTFQQAVAACGLNGEAISVFLVAAGHDSQRLIAIANSVFALDRSAGRSAQINALCRAATADIDHMMAAMNLTIDDVAALLQDDSDNPDALIRHLAPRGIPSKFLNKLVNVKWLVEAGHPRLAFAKAMNNIKHHGRHNNHKDFFDIAYAATRTARRLHDGAGYNPYLLELMDAAVPRLRQGHLIDWFITFAPAAVKNGELAVDTVTAALITVLNDAAAELSRPNGRRLFKLLRQIDGTAIIQCLDAYLALCPVSGEAAAEHLGSGGWDCYRAGDNARYLELTERALDFAPQADWLLANRAFARHLLGQPGTDVMTAYAQTLAVTPDRERWYVIAVEDLEKHTERRPGAEPIAAALIAEVTALGESLPFAQPPQDTAAPA